MSKEIGDSFEINRGENDLLKLKEWVDNAIAHGATDFYREVEVSHDKFSYNIDDLYIVATKPEK